MSSLACCSDRAAVFICQPDDMLCECYDCSLPAVISAWLRLYARSSLTSGSPWWCQAHLGSDRRGDQRHCQGVPGARHPRCRDLHRARSPQNSREDVVFARRAKLWRCAAATALRVLCTWKCRCGWKATCNRQVCALRCCCLAQADSLCCSLQGCLRSQRSRANLPALTARAHPDMGF